MGIIGLIWIIFAYYTKNKIRFFLLYNIVQSMIIAVFLAIFKLSVGIILSILAKIPFLDFAAAIIYYILNFQIIKIFNLSLTPIEFILFLLFAYIFIGILLGRIFYIPYLTDIMQKSMKKYY